MSEPRLLLGRQILGIRNSNLSDNYFPKYFISSHFNTKKITNPKKSKRIIKESMINIEPKVIFKFDQLWRWLPPLTTAAAKGGKSDEAPSGAKIRPNGKETKQFGAKKQPNWSTPSDQAILISLACLGQSVSWNHKIGVLLVKPKVICFKNIRVGTNYFETVQCHTAMYCQPFI